MRTATTPAISILIPAYNVAATLDEALQSLCDQTFRDWEAVLVDDGSQDATPAVLARWAERDPRFRVFRNERNLGLVATFNRALDAARAPVLARMDGDDICLPRRLELQWQRFLEGDVAAVGCQVRYFPDDLVGGGARRYETWLNSLTTPDEHDRDIFVECPLAHPSMLLDANAVREVGGYQAHGWAEDFDLCLRLWAAGYRLAKVPELLLLWRESPHRTSRTHPDYHLDAFHRCKVHYLRQTCLSGNRPAMVFGAGPVGKALARALLSAGTPLRAFVDLDPRKIGQRIYGVPVLHLTDGFRLRGKAFGLVALAQPGARQEARNQLLAAKWEEGVDFRCVA